MRTKERKKHIIWTWDVTPEDWRDYLKDEIEKEEDLYRLASEYNDEYLQDEIANLDLDVGSDIIMIADLGLWNGRHTGYKLLKTSRLNSVFGTALDRPTWYVDELGDLCCDDSHHDGTNHYLYRAWKPETSETKKENFLEKVYTGKVTRKDITRATKSIGGCVKAVYGWA